MEQMDVNKRENLEGKVAEILDGDADLSAYKPMVESMLRLEYGAVEISAALLKLLDDSTQSKKHDALDEVDYGKKFRARGLRKDRKSKEKKTNKKRFSNNAKLYMDKGRKDGITPKAILAIFKKETDLGRDVVGNILIRDRHTVIEVPKKAAKSAIEQLDGMKSRGKTYHVRVYRD